MTTKQVMEIVEKRGLKIELKDGQPVLSKASGKPEVTDKLLAVLKFHRPRIIQLLKEREPSRPA